LIIVNFLVTLTHRYCGQLHRAADLCCAQALGDGVGDVLEEFVAANQSEEDIEAKSLWADVRIAVRVLASETARPPTASSGKPAVIGASAHGGS
jgi:hypothetical protein